MRLLLLGGSGQVGTELRALAATEGVTLTAPERGEFDLTDRSALVRLISAAPWDAVINAAAYTDVDRAEREEDFAFAVNAEAPSHLAAETARRAIPLVHISTDYVFDGEKGAPYVEDDMPAPLNAYGRSKLAGERGVSTGNPRHVILRTSWVYSPFGKNFVKTILRLANERDRLTVVDDQRGSPTAARDIAQACLTIAMRCARAPAQVPYGIYHFAGAGEATWCEFARAIVALATDRLPRIPSVEPIRTIDYPTPAFRAADTRLDCTAVAGAFGLVPRPWREALKETLDRLLTNRNIA
jgi:dTDP-4-dehydrorhamnose reductase